MITASRFGMSGLMLDWSGLNLLVGTQSAESRDEYNANWLRTIAKLRERVSGFYEAAVDAKLNQLEESVAAAEKILAESPHIRDCLFIGIGGSSLGPMCLLDSLKHRAKPTHGRTVKFHFFENPDPIDWQFRIAQLRPASTLVCVVTKSGTTYETLALFMLAYDWLKQSIGAPAASKQVIAITDPEKGELREFCVKENISMLTIDPCVGGRYSVFTPVGFFAGALAGLNMPAFLQGGKKIRDYCEKTADGKVTPEKNLFITWAHALQTLSSSNAIHVMMPYSTSLRLVANWWVQLWAESLGKNGKGFTAVPALGAIDQHSMLQLLRDGPNDKIMWFINIQEFKTPIKIPSVGFKVKTFELLEGQDLGTLLSTEFRSTQRVMMTQKRPSLQIQLDELTEETMGSLMFTFCILTSYMGDVMGVNPFDQPGVEEGKVYLREKLTELKTALYSGANDPEETHRLRLHKE